MSNTRLFYVFVLGLSLMMTGCSLFSSQEQPASDSASTASSMSGNSEYDNMLAEVTAEFKALAKEGGAWSISEETLEKAAEAAKNKEFDKAVKLLKDVRDETALAKAQFEQAKTAGPHLF
jgi:predicted Zn-dependent peptidase